MCSNNNGTYLGPIIVVALGAHHAPPSFNVKTHLDKLADNVGSTARWTLRVRISSKAIC